ncbi:MULTISPECIES: hypothetical protein [unclassified Sphingobacterium]|uniref:hypothetical protein n=1 Tax=unclassified Sphingobacterium TaxID=2609468 RepID=UPI00265D49FB|nr:MULTISPECIES: hypothetical protein [unclassified Sphingobacterium]WKK57600.1 hypothetical protein QYC40_13280 [Sphingobacterium sp. BN32]
MKKVLINAIGAIVLFGATWYLYDRKYPADAFYLKALYCLFITFILGVFILFFGAKLKKRQQKRS